MADQSLADFSLKSLEIDLFIFLVKGIDSSGAVGLQCHQR